MRKNTKPKQLTLPIYYQNPHLVELSEQQDFVDLKRLAKWQGKP